MAVTTRTWVDGELITAAIGNAQWRDNIDALLAGGLAVSGQAAYDVFYASTASQLARVATGTSGQVLTCNGAAAPTWNTPTTTTPVTQTTSATGTQNNFALTAQVSVLLCTGAAPSFTGFSAGNDGQVVDVVVLGTSGRVTHQGAGSTAANRCVSPSTNGLIVGVNGVIRIIYDLANARWRIMTLSAGTPLTATFAAGDFTADAGTWTVASGDVTTLTYVQINKQVTVTVKLVTTTVGGGTGTQLRIANTQYGGFTATKTTDAILSKGNNIASSGWNGQGVVRAAAGDTKLLCLGNENTDTWAVSTDQTQIAFVTTFEVD